MPIVKRIVCLANSRKLSGRCIAGKELTLDGPGSWIRPVSDRPHEEVSESERSLGLLAGEPRLLDIVDVPVQHAQPSLYQTENWLLAPDLRWKRVGRLATETLVALADDPPTLWVNGASTSRGTNDRVPVARAAQLRSSLYLLRLESLELHVSAPYVDLGDRRRRVQAVFSHRSIPYRLWVTDPLVERQYLAGADGTFHIGPCSTTISLGEANDDGFCYKLVAALILPDKARKWWFPF